jgi:hypothetical protein
MTPTDKTEEQELALKAAVLAQAVALDKDIEPPPIPREGTAGTRLIYVDTFDI